MEDTEIIYKNNMKGRNLQAVGRGMTQKYKTTGQAKSQLIIKLPAVME